jgi:hypothetical protein
MMSLEISETIMEINDLQKTYLENQRLRDERF